MTLYTVRRIARNLTDTSSTYPRQTVLSARGALVSKELLITTIPGTSSYTGRAKFREKSINADLSHNRR